MKIYHNIHAKLTGIGLKWRSSEVLIEIISMIRDSKIMQNALKSTKTPYTNTSRSRREAGLCIEARERRFANERTEYRLRPKRAVDSSNECTAVHGRSATETPPMRDAGPTAPKKATEPR